ncbi:universal stress protein [Nonomuraea sp. NPDC049750]|uniref:universal stress protein n=1 Tax=Nonomuraea sp. NPDC049750 TaxID=3154738 RepID=UPI003408D8AA
MIVVGVDGSMTARAAVEWAVNDALRMGESLRIVHAVDRSPYQIGRFPNAAVPDALLREGHRILREALALAHERQPEVEGGACLAVAGACVRAGGAVRDG